jgi:hypothetical protein
MRLRTVWQSRRRIGQASACILIAAVCCTLFPIQALGFEETTNAALFGLVQPLLPWRSSSLDPRKYGACAHAALSSLAGDYVPLPVRINRS